MPGRKGQGASCGGSIHHGTRAGGSLGHIDPAPALGATFVGGARTGRRVWHAKARERAGGGGMLACMRTHPLGSKQEGGVDVNGGGAVAVDTCYHVSPNSGQDESYLRVAEHCL